MIKFKMYKKETYVFLILLLSLNLIFSCTSSEKKKIPRAHNGIINLKDYNFERNGPVELEGFWKFHWKEFKSYKDLVSERKTLNGDNILVPGVWNQLGYDGLGYGTYHLKIILSDNFDKDIALKFKTISAAFDVFIDAKKVYSCGKIGNKPEESRPSYKPDVIIVENPQDTIDLIVHVSNFHYNKGGIWQEVILGSQEGTYDIRARNILLDLFLFGSILIMGLYHIGLFVLRRKYRTPLYFGLFCICLAFRNIFTGEYYIIDIFPNISYLLIAKFEYLTLMFGLPPFTVFIYSFFRKYFSLFIARIIIASSLIMALFVIVTPVRIFSYIIIPFQILVLFCCIYTLFIIIKSLNSKIHGSIIFIIGFLIFVFSSVNDILYYNNIINSTDLTKFGFLIFIFALSIILSSGFSKAFLSIENLSGEINIKNKELIKLNELKDEFLANTSHELRTPLNGIIGIAESLIDGAEGDLSEHVKSEMSVITSSGKRLSELVNDILDFSKLKSKDVKLIKRPIDIKLVTDIVLSLSRHLLKEKSIELRNEVPEKFPFVLGDENRIQQVLQILVGNAVKFTTKGEIVVSAKEISMGDAGDSFAEISISDTGAGLSSDKLGQIRSFFNLDTQTLSGNEIIGFGLAITKSLVHLHNGKISVSSEEGIGSAFKFTIPMSSEKFLEKEISEIYLKHNKISSIDIGNITREEGKVRRQVDVPVEIDKRKGLQDRREVVRDELYSEDINVLVVDDDPINLQVISNTLRVVKMNSINANSGLEALKVLEKSKPDIVLLDIMMPRMTGFETAKKIREKYSYEDLPIIFLTARDQVNDFVEGFSSGANDYITKPFSKNELITRLRFHVNFKRVIDENKKFLSIEKEVEVARRIQQSTLPTEVPKLSSLRCAVAFIPMDQVGGDYYDYCIHSEEEISILISDVSGHGIPAALIASMVKIIFNIKKDLTKKPGEFLSQMNSILHGNIERQFLTSSCIYVNLKEKKLYYSNAGHLPLIIYKDKKEIFEYKPYGKLIGIYDRVDYDEEILEISSGDRIILYTDGITEAIRKGSDPKNINVASDMFGIEKFHEAIHEGMDMDPSEFSDFLIDRLRDWTGKSESFQDDLTFVVVDVE